MTTHTIPTPSTIAPHLREPIFRAYEPLITRAISAFTSTPRVETSFSVPHGTAPSTFVANFRNAILSLKQYKWETTVDVAALWSINKQYVITRETDGLVWFRARGRAGAPNLLTSEARSHTAHTSHLAFSLGLVPWLDATQDEISALCLLIHTKRITGPVVIIGQIGWELTQSLLAQYDVAIVWDGTEGKTVIT